MPLSLTSSLMLFIPVLVNVAFITLLERKILALMQNRKGPNKAYFLGIFQPFADAIKLFNKQNLVMYKSHKKIFLISPTLGLFLLLMIWNFMPYPASFSSINFSLIGLMMILALGIFPLYFAGWASNSKYALLGAIRGIAQTISYEITLGLSFLSLALIANSTSINTMFKMNYGTPLLMFAPLLFIIWLITCVAETNRTPFDFAEGESELVSGFNVEYSGCSFALIFMAEYGMILFFSALTSLFFISPKLSDTLTFFTSGMLAFFWIWLRATFPRYRYDKLMSFGWKIMLPIMLTLVMYYMMFSY